MKKFSAIILSVTMFFSTVFAVSSADLSKLSSYAPLNSWRYTNGVPDNAYDSGELFSSGASGSFVPWSKTKDGYINSYGNVIKGATMKGADVSQWNGNIDWAKVKKSDVDYAIIRVGYGDNYTYQDDTYFKKNADACVANKIPFGVYIYSYAMNNNQALSEAKHVLRLIKGYKLDFPVYYDLEDYSQTKLSKATLGSMAKTFCNAIQKEGYEVGIYANLNWWNNYLTDSAFNNTSWYKWVAQYNYQCDYKKSYTMWQCTSDGTVSGMSGRVDLNFWYDKVRKSSYEPTVTKATPVSQKNNTYVFNRKSNSQYYNLKLDTKSVVDSMNIPQPTPPATEPSTEPETEPENQPTTETSSTVSGTDHCLDFNTENESTATENTEVVVPTYVTQPVVPTEPEVDPREILSIAWKSTNTTVASVNSNGKVTLKKKGTCYVTATVTVAAGISKSVKYKITIKQLVTKVKLNKTSVTLKKKGKKCTLKATCTPTNANNKKVKWTTTKSKIAKVNQKGKVTATKKGVCYIKATAKDGSKKYAKCKVTVLKNK